MERPTGQENEWEWIERYWTGQLPAAEKVFFEQVMNEDPRFAQEVASLQYGLKAMETIHMEQHIRQTLQQLHTSGRQQQLTRTRWISWGGGLAAACLAALLILFVKPVRLPGYENDWEVIRDLNSQYQADSTDQRKQAFDLFFEAQALYSEGQSGPAAHRFEQVLNFTRLRPYFREAVQWHLVVCYLNTGQPEKAKDIYNQLKGKDAYDVGLVDRWQIGWRIWLAT
ncbi:tetratricopeptide repeat protein [Fibrella forsythiae]|uniref:Tetratricopeptide repeat protein n=1 Tax=Fibrella forsythiae TaxID=2817061 RepID=A0ABS3JLN2_9BACT|nr:hypothetical protein [Fibrella forsythiae]MBO0950917.1 hypothetical protein [Fibrella forsythiae]